MGQRFTIDADIFQKLVYRNIEKDSEGNTKLLPSFIEIPAALGDDTALDIIHEDKDFFGYPNYEEVMQNIRAESATFSEDKWTQNLYWGWLYSLESFVGENTAGYPDFMKSDKWERKELNTFAGSWTELKHDTILYSKQVFAELGSGPGPDQVPDDRGYVEPNVELWNRLLSLVRMTRDGLNERGITEEYSGDAKYAAFDCRNNTSGYKQEVDCSLLVMENLVLQLRDISTKQLNGDEITQEDYDFIRLIGGQLESLFFSTLDPNVNKYSAIDDNPVMLVADVATDPNGRVLEQGLGYVNNIYVIVPIEGRLTIAKGGVFSQYEFEWPLNDRLTNDKWRDMVENGEISEMQKWQKELITK